MTSLFERLNDNEIILLDGGVSTEIQKRGVAMDSDVWSGLAHKSHPEVVLQVHEDYIRAGAQVITANTYSTARHVLESIDMGGEVRASTLRLFNWPKRHAIILPKMKPGLPVRCQVWLLSTVHRKSLTVKKWRKTIRN